MIYVGIYHFNNILYFIYFITGFIFDIFLLNEIGPHLITFMLMVVICSQVKKYLSSWSSIKIILLIFLILVLFFLSEIFISFILYNYSFKFSILMKKILISFLIAYPTFYFFNKIDRLG